MCLFLAPPPWCFILQKWRRGSFAKWEVLSRCALTAIMGSSTGEKTLYGVNIVQRSSF